MTITYAVTVDLNDDGDFVDASEVLSADVIGLHWRLGMAAPYDSISVPSEAQITLRNTSQKYSPETVSALALLPGKTLRISSNDGTLTRLHFHGIIERVEPLPGTLSKRTAVIHAAGGEKQLAQATVRLPPQVNVTADAVIRAVFERLPFRRDILKSRAVLDVVGNAELGTNTYLADDVSRVLDVGKSTFAYVGDTWVDGIPADEALRQIADSERGRFFFDRFGEAIFINRHRTLLDTTAVATFDNNADELEYAYAGDLANRVTVSIMPRTIGAAGTELWKVDSVQRVNALSRRELVVRYRDSDKRSVGALAVIAPVPNVDYIANTAADGTGVDVTAFVEIALVKADFSAALLEIRNAVAGTVYILAGMRLRGTPLYQDDPLTVEQTDWQGVTFHGLRTLHFDLPAITSTDEAEQMARYELARRKSPRGTLRRMHLNTIKHAAALLARSLFERITVKDTQTGHDADYFIIAEEHTVNHGGTRHRAVWTLEPASASKFAKLNVAELDEGYALAY